MGLLGEEMSEKVWLGFVREGPAWLVPLGERVNEGHGWGLWANE